MNNPKVSVIVPIYNSERFVAQAIESVLAQTYKNFEIVVVNDGSTDRSYEKIKPYLPLIKYIPQENKGVSSARNTGIKNSEGELIAFLDSDDIWLPEKLELQVKYLNDNPHVGLVHSNISYIDENGESYPPNPDFVTDVSGMCFKELFEGNCIATSTVLVRQACLDKVGLFAEGIPYAEDYELWMKLSIYYPIRHINEYLIKYRVHDANASNYNFINAIFELRAIKSILKEFSQTKKIVGKRVVKKRLFNLYSKIAEFQANEGNKLKSIRYSLFTMGISPIKFFSEHLWNLLSPSQKKVLSWYKYKIKHSLNKC